MILSKVNLGDDGEKIGRETFIPGVEVLTVDWLDGRHATTLVLESDRDVTVDELRTLATVFEAFPTWLRDRADERRRIRRPLEVTERIAAGGDE